ncbi:MAG: phage portal protein [Gammaproteobacteria bacterium]|nr:phage portal protein [Gammaproteobacteria bacterium]
MGFLSTPFNFLLQTIEGRGATYTSGSIKDPRWWSSFGSQDTKSGQSVTPDSALRISAVYACVRLLSELIASLPLPLYMRKKDNTKKLASNHNVFRLLHDSPNPRQTAYEFREMKAGHLVLRGNFYSWKQINYNNGDILNLWPLHPDRMTVEERGENLFYSYIWPDGTQIEYDESEIWHVRGLSSDGIKGINPIQIARESVGVAMAAEEHGARMFSNKPIPAGFLKWPGSLKEDAIEKLRDQWQSMFTGSGKHSVGVLTGNLEWQSIGMTNEDAQFLETRRFQVEDIARIFRVPPMMIGHPDKTATYASSEQFMLSLIIHTLRPWLVRIEQSVNKHLLRPNEQRRYFAEHIIEGLLRGDIKTRYEAYSTARNWGWLNVDEIRQRENMNPLPDNKGQEYLKPLNMIEAGQEVNNNAGNTEE